MKKIYYHFFVLSLLFLNFNLAYSMDQENNSLPIQKRLALTDKEEISEIDHPQYTSLLKIKSEVDDIKKNMEMTVNKMDHATCKKIYLDILNSISSICQKLKNMNEENNATDLDTFDSIASICRTLYKENDNADIIDLDILDSISSECQELKKMDKKDNEIYINMINFIFSICQKLEKRKS